VSGHGWQARNNLPSMAVAGCVWVWAGVLGRAWADTMGKMCSYGCGQVREVWSEAGVQSEWCHALNRVLRLSRSACGSTSGVRHILWRTPNKPEGAHPFDPTSNRREWTTYEGWGRSKALQNTSRKYIHHRRPGRFWSPPRGARQDPGP
jgi:hypothetical protein